MNRITRSVAPAHKKKAAMIASLFEFELIYCGLITVLPSRMTADCARARPLMVAPV